MLPPMTRMARVRAAIVAIKSSGQMMVAVLNVSINIGRVKMIGTY